MSQESATEFIDRMEMMGKLSILDLPPEIHRLIIKKLDLPCQFKLRVNKKLDGLVLSVKNNVEKIKGDIGEDYYDFLVTPSNRSSPLRSRDYDKLEQGLRRLALNTHVDMISFEVKRDPNPIVNPWRRQEEEKDVPLLDSQVNRVVDELLQFNADSIKLCSSFHDGICRFFCIRKLFNLPLLDHSRLFRLSENVRDVTINGLICTSLTAQDFCTLRKAMIDRRCKMERFTVLVPGEMNEAVLDACFGVTFDHDVSLYIMRTYRAKDESVELYSYCPDLHGLDLHHYEGNFESSFKGKKHPLEVKFENRITFELHEKKIELSEDLELIRFNQPYLLQFR